jgi:pimeloyl-ACP methyl ester carboxylesterase
MVRSKWRRKVLRIIVPVGVVYLILLFAVFFGQRRLLYFPNKVSLDLSLAMAKRSGFEAWNNSAGQFIGWKKLSATNGPRDRILITHGNAGSAIDRVDYAHSLNQVEDCDVYILEYPGYGPRPGAPMQSSLFDAADEAMALLEKEGPVYVVGESLGTGVAAYIAGTHPRAVTGLLLIAPYHNLGDVAQNHMPIFPARLMILDKFPSASYLQSFHGAVGVLLAGRDTVVPNKFGRKLFDAYSGPKKVWEIPLASHNDLPNVPVDWWRELVAFWKGRTGIGLKESAP